MGKYLQRRRPRQRCDYCDGTGAILVYGQNDWDCDEEDSEECTECDGRGRFGDWPLRRTLADQHCWAMLNMKCARGQYGRAIIDRTNYLIEFAIWQATARALRLAIRDGAIMTRSLLGAACVRLPDGREVNAIQHYGLVPDLRPLWRARTAEAIRTILAAITAGHTARVELTDHRTHRIEVEMGALHAVEPEPGNVTYARLYNQGTGQYVQLDPYIVTGQAFIGHPGGLHSLYWFGTAEAAWPPDMRHQLKVSVPVDEPRVRRDDTPFEEFMARRSREWPRHERKMWEQRAARVQA